MKDMFVTYIKHVLNNRNTMKRNVRVLSGASIYFHNVIHNVFEVPAAY